MTKRGSKRRRVRAPERSREKDNLDHYRRFAETLTVVDDDTGDRRPFEPEDWQLELLGYYFDGYLEVVALIPSGNGKTTLWATVALHHGTYVATNCRVLINSSTGKQARQMYEAAASMIDGSKTLKSWWTAQEYGHGRIKSRTDRGVIEIVASIKSGEGEVPSLLLGDELHRVVDGGSAYTTLVSKLKKRKARTLAASTAGGDVRTFLGTKRAIALSAPNIVQGHLNPGSPEPRPGEFFSTALDPDRVTAWLEWSCPDWVKPDDWTAIKRANPLSTITEKEIRETAKLMAAKPGEFARQIMNRWIAGTNPAIDPLYWREGGEADIGPVENAPFWIGFDMGGTSDSTGLVPVWRIEDVDEQGKSRPRFVTARGRIVWPPGEGRWTLVKDIIGVLDDLVQLPGNFQGLVFDSARGGGYVATELSESRDWVVINHSQGTEMDDASELLARAVIEGRLKHDGNTEITNQVLGAVAKRSRRNRWYLAKEKPELKIDAAIALAMALRVASAWTPPAPFNVDDYSIERL